MVSVPAGAASASLPEAMPGGRHNRDVAWDRFDTGAYLAHNYARLHAFDHAIISALSPYYAGIAPGSVRRSLDVGTGPNLYPLMLAAAASEQLEVLERSAANVRYLRAACRDGMPAGWRPFWQLCRALDAALPEDFDEVLHRVSVRQGDAFDLPHHRYDLVSMFFVAESVTGDRDEFEQLCRSFVRAARPGGHLVAAFMAGMPGYELGGDVLPAFPLDEAALTAVARPVAEDLRVWRLPADPNLDYEHDGVLLLTARAQSR